MSEFRRAIANVETLESRLLELQNALAADNINRVFQDTFSFVLLAINGEMNATMDKFRARCSMIDPVTKNPRFGPKMMAKVKDMLRRYDNVKLAIQEDTPLRLQIETKLNDLKQHEEEAKEAEAIRKKEAEEDQRAAERAAEQDGKRLEEEAQEREILRRRQEELRIQRLAVAAQKKREQRERERLEEEQQRQEEQKKRELLNASISPGKKGLELAIDLLRESTGSEALFRQSVEKLLAVVNNICKSPDNTAFRQIPKDNMHFHADLGQFTGGYQCLLALGFKEMQQGDENEPRFVFVMEEPDLSEDLDAWSTWFDGLKEMQNFVESKL
ncbi:putative PUB domain-containing protein [Plasmopara halstedii]